MVPGFMTGRDVLRSSLQRPASSLPEVSSGALWDNRLHWRRRAAALLSAGIYRRSFVIVSLAGGNRAVGIRGIRVQNGIDFHIRTVCAAAAINVVARNVQAGVPIEVDTVLCHRTSTTQRFNRLGVEALLANESDPAWPPEFCGVNATLNDRLWPAVMVNGNEAPSRMNCELLLAAE